MKRNLQIFIAVLGLVLTLVMAMSIPAMASEQTLPATVWVNELLSFTIEDNGTPGLSFGTLVPGAVNKPEVSQSHDGAVTVEIGAESNVDCDVNTKANDFVSGPNIMTIDNVKWNTEGDYSTATPMKKQYATVTILSPGESRDIWHWLTISSNQAPGNYTTTFYFQAERI